MKKTTWFTLLVLAMTNCAETGGQDVSESTVIAAPDEQLQLMKRWNTSIKNTAVTALAITASDFEWPAYDQFPHPTYRGGTAEAYQVFATLLLAFMQHTDDFQYLAEHRLFDVRLGYRMADGTIGIDWSFRELAAWFATESGFFELAEEDRSAFAKIVAQIETSG